MNILAVILLLLSISACNDYQVTINDQSLYSPPALFTDYHLADLALNQCVSQAISEQKIVQAGQLRQLNCSHAGIKQLDGLQRFTQLETVNLANNQLGDIRILMFLGALQQVNLQGNNKLNCTDLQILANLLAKQLVEPENCLQELLRE